MVSNLFLVSGSSLDFLYDGCGLPVLCLLVGVLPVNAYWCLKLEYWDGLGEGRLEENVFVIC